MPIHCPLQSCILTAPSTGASNFDAHPPSLTVMHLDSPFLQKPAILMPIHCP